MLHWLQLNTPRRVSFFIELIAVSVLFHAITIFALFFWHARNDPGCHIILGLPSVDLADIVVVPFSEPPVHEPVQKAQTVSQPSSKKSVPRQKSPARTSLKKAPVKKVVPKKKPAPQKKVAQAPVKKAAPKKVEQKVEQKKESTPIKKDQKKPVPKKQEPAAPAKEVKQDTISESNQMAVSPKEYDALELQQLLQEELERHWQPPEGLAQDLSCEVKIVVGQGAVEQLDVVAPSGVLIYDVYAQSTLMALQYPKQTWGKQLTVTFKQT